MPTGEYKITAEMMVFKEVRAGKHHTRGHVADPRVDIAIQPGLVTETI